MLEVWPLNKPWGLERDVLSKIWVSAESAVHAQGPANAEQKLKWVSIKKNNNQKTKTKRCSICIWEQGGGACAGHGVELAVCLQRIAFNPMCERLSSQSETINTVTGRIIVANDD